MHLSGGKKATLGRRDLDLDAVRGLAILLAMGWHLNHPKTGMPIVDAVLAPGRTFGWAGVDLFFVLSGFLVGGIVLRESADGGRFRAGRFMGRRVLKLWPVLYVYFAVQLVTREHAWNTYLPQGLFHIQNYTGTSLSPLWSLAVEEHFYLAVMLFYPVFARRSGQPATLVKILVSIMVIAPMLRIVAVVAHLQPVTISWQSQYRADALACGVLLAVVAVHYPAMWARMLWLRPVWFVFMTAGVAWLCLVPQMSTLNITIGYTVTYLTGAALLLLMRDAAIVRRAPALFRPLAFLGVYSYSLYIWHPAAAQIGDRLAARAGAGGSTVTVLACRYGAAILVAICITRLIEWPCLRLRDRLFPRRVARPVHDQAHVRPPHAGHLLEEPISTTPLGVPL